MKKRSTYVLLAFSVFFAILPATSANSAVNPVANASCSPKGKIVVYAGSKYTCVLSNKKLVWDRGVKVSTTATSTTTTTEPIVNQTTVYTASMTKPHQPVGTSGGKDDYRCFLLDPKISLDSYVTSVQFVPQQRPFVHHALFWSVNASSAATYKQLDNNGNGWSCFGGVTADSSTADIASTLSGWAPGRPMDVWPSGYGTPISKGALIVMQVHYNLLAALGGAVPTDQSKVLISAVPAALNSLQPLYGEAFAAPVELPCPSGVNGGLCDRTKALNDLADRTTLKASYVEAGLLIICGKDPFNPVANLTSTCDKKITSTETAIQAGAHMHLLGTRLQLILNPGKASEQLLLDSNPYDFDNQAPVTLKKPVPLKPGDVVRIVCTYNPGLHLLIPQLQQLPWRYVTWGDGSSDEMCLGSLRVTRP